MRKFGEMATKRKCMACTVYILQNNNNNNLTWNIPARKCKWVSAGTYYQVIIDKIIFFYKVYK